MINISIREGSSDRTVEEFQRVLNSLVDVERITKVKIFYEKSKGLPDYNCPLDKYPVIFYTDICITIHLFSLTAGYNGTGPNHLLDVLKMAGFSFIHPYYITGAHEIVDLTFSKE